MPIIIFDLIFILSFSVVVFLFLPGETGKNIKKLFKFILTFSNMAYIMGGLILGYIVYFSIKHNLLFCVDEETEKQLIGSSENNVKNTTFMSKFLNNYQKYKANLEDSPGLGTAIGSGMTATSSVVAKAPLTLPVKLGLILAGGLGGASTYVIFNNMFLMKNANNMFLMKNANNFSKTLTSIDSKFNTKSMLEENETVQASYENVINFLYANFTLHISMLYFILIFGIIYLNCNYLNIDNEYIRKIKAILSSVLSPKLYNAIFSGFKLYSKYNQFLLVIIWILLIIFCSASVYSAYFLIEHIETISKIVENK